MASDLEAAASCPSPAQVQPFLSFGKFFGVGSNPTTKTIETRFSLDSAGFSTDFHRCSTADFEFPPRQQIFFC